MSFTESVKTCFNKYVTFKGRATRSEYWWFTLGAYVLIALVSLLIFALFNVVAMFFAYIATALAVSLPAWSVAVRRLHDTNHSGWWLLCPVYPIILMFIEGSEGENDYGADESDLQLTCPICSELVDASASVCPHCGEATHFDLAEPASSTDRKVAIGVIAFCGLLLIGGIAFSFSDIGKVITGEGYDLSEYEDYDLEEVDAIESEDDDIVYPEYSSTDDSEIEEELNRLEAKLGELGQSVHDELRDEGDISVYTGQEIMNSDGIITTLGEKINQMTPDQRQRYQELKDAITKMAKALNLYE